MLHRCAALLAGAPLAPPHSVASAPRRHTRRGHAATHAAGGAPAGKKRGGASGRGDKPAAAWPYEQLMLIWDDAFVACMRDPARAGELERVSREGLAAAGRGCVLCCARVETGGGKGFGAGAARRAVCGKRACRG